MGIVGFKLSVDDFSLGCDILEMLDVELTHASGARLEYITCDGTSRRQGIA
jgi:hypothetical protein